MTIWYENDAWKLEAWHNGLSFELTNKRTNTSVFVQGDDASQFQYDLETCEKHFPNNTHAENYARLWDQHDYGSIAQ